MDYILYLYMHQKVNMLGVQISSISNDDLLAASPDVLLVSLTAPKQDIWIAQNKHALNATLLVGIGGAFE